MAKGDIKKLKFESFYDSESNNEVIRLTQQIFFAIAIIFIKNVLQMMVKN